MGRSDLILRIIKETCEEALHPENGDGSEATISAALLLKSINEALSGQVTDDTIVESNIAFLLARNARGVRKYGTTLDRADLTTIEWVEHTRGEVADELNYLERLKQDLIEMREAIVRLDIGTCCSGWMPHEQHCESTGVLRRLLGLVPIAVTSERKGAPPEGSVDSEGQPASRPQPLTHGAGKATEGGSPAGAGTGLRDVHTGVPE